MFSNASSVKRRFGAAAGALLMLGATLAVACVDMSAPKGPAYISTLLLPSPSVVVGDVMRDSNGTPAPLAIVAYNSDNSAITGSVAQFFVVDTLRYAHLTSGNQLFGDKIGTTRVVGQIGNLQTTAISVPVTYAPDTLKKVTAFDTLNAPLGADSATSLSTLALGVMVRSALDSAAQGFIVHYVIIHAPRTASSATSPAVYLADDNGKPALADTSDATGLASPRLAVNTYFMADSARFVTGTYVDSVVIDASAKYNGRVIKGSPIRFIVRLTALFKL